MYLLDTNTFIEAQNTYYGFALAPGFWQWVEAAHARGLIASIKAVERELKVQEDQLAEWADTLPKTFWLESDNDTVNSLGVVAQWAMDKNLAYRDAARASFLKSADYELVAAAHAGKHTVITREVSSPQSLKNIKLPDACAANRVPVKQPWIAYQELGLLLRLP
jgi:hypothetical protein